MKIIFICGSLEPGKDGVGDYTRRLCGELIKQGVSVGMLAFNDKYIPGKIDAFQMSEDISIPCLRLSHTWKSKARCKEAKIWIDLHNPEWLSLQFVIYSFNNKGLPFGLGSQLKNIGGIRKWHIMFHELWLGVKEDDPVKYRLIGFLQRRIIKSLVKNLNFQVVHTHTKFYLYELNKLHLKIDYLPIFSNIPLNKTHIRRSNALSKTNKIIFVLFGTIHPGAPVKSFSIEMSNYFKSKKEIDCVLILVGKSGEAQKEWVEEFKFLGIETIILGEQSPEIVSNILQDATYGITTNPIFVVEKSGTVAAMREHDLPIIIVSKKTNPKDKISLNYDFDLFEYQSGNFENFMFNRPIDKKASGIRDVSFKFLNSLEI